jgi:hypothetical protein
VIGVNTQHTGKFLGWCGGHKVRNRRSFRVRQYGFCCHDLFIQLIIQVPYCSSGTLQRFLKLQIRLSPISLLR